MLLLAIIDLQPPGAAYCSGEIAQCMCACVGVFASGGEDQLIAVWDLERTGETSAAVAAGASADEEQQPALPHQLMFQHAGHRSQVIFAAQSVLLALS